MSRTAQGSNPNQKFIFGMLNENYAGPQSASGEMDRDVATGAAQDFAAAQDERLSQEDIDEAVEDLLDVYRDGEDPLADIVKEHEGRYNAVMENRLRGVDDSGFDESREDIRSKAWAYSALQRSLKRYVEAENSVEDIKSSVDWDNPLVQEAKEKARTAPHSHKDSSGQQVTVVGYVSITEPQTRTQRFETARWYQEHTIAPGVYEVTLDKSKPRKQRDPNSGQIVDRMSVQFDTVKGGSDFTSLYGGVPIGGSQVKEIDQHVGEEGVYHDSVDAYTMPRIYTEGQPQFGGNLFLCEGVEMTDERSIDPDSGVLRMRNDLVVPRTKPQ